MKSIFTIAVALCAFSFMGCAKSEPAAPQEPGVEVKTMEEVGKLTPEEEAAKIKSQDSRPEEDKSEGGI